MNLCTLARGKGEGKKKKKPETCSRRIFFAIPSDNLTSLCQVLYASPAVIWGTIHHGQHSKHRQ